MQVNLEIPARPAGIGADETCIIRLINRGLQGFAFADVFPADVDVAIMRAHGEGRDQAAFDQCMRIMAHDLAVFAGAGFGFVGIDHKIAGPAIRLLGHERPFKAGRKPCSATTAQARCLDLFDQPVTTLCDEARRS